MPGTKRLTIFLSAMFVVACDAPPESEPIELVVAGQCESEASTPQQGCESCFCPTCDDEADYEDAFCGVNPDQCQQGVAARKALEQTVPDDITDRCMAVAQYEPPSGSETFNCRDYTKWFLKCLNDLGYTGTGLSIGCKNCLSGDPIGHRIVIIKRPIENFEHDMYCPVEPHLLNGLGVIESCCSTSKSSAELCAHQKWCSGMFGDPQIPYCMFDGCQVDPNYRTPRTCEFCLAETCSESERRAVCGVLGESPYQPEYCVVE